MVDIGTVIVLLCLFAVVAMDTVILSTMLNVGKVGTTKSVAVGIVADAFGEFVVCDKWSETVDIYNMVFVADTDLPVVVRVTNFVLFADTG